MTIFAGFFHVVFTLLLLVHPFLRGGWDLATQAGVHMLWGLFLVLAGALLLVLRRRQWADPLWQAFSGTFPVLCLFLLSSLASAFASPFPHSVMPAALNDITALCFFYLFAASREDRREDYRRALMGAAALVILVRLGVAAGRLEGWGEPLVNPNVLAAFLVLMIPMLAVSVLEGRSFLRRAAWGAVAAAGAACLFLTGSFMAYLALAAEGVLLWWGYFRSPRYRGRDFENAAARRATAVAVGVVILAGIWIFRHDWARLAAMEADRLQWWKGALRMWVHNPLLGVGPGAFGEAYPGYRGGSWGLNSLYAHNFFLEMLAERGLAGMGAFLLFLLSLWIRFRHSAVSRDTFWILNAALLGLAGFLLHNLAHIGFAFPSLSWSFWALAGYVWAESTPGPAGQRFVPEVSVPPAGMQERRKAPRFHPVFQLHLEMGTPPAKVQSVFLAGGILLGLLTGLESYFLVEADRCLARARAALEAENTESARRYIQKGLRWNPREPEFYSLRARLEAEKGDRESALIDARQSVRLSPHTARFHMEAAELELKTGNAAGAYDHYQKAGRYLPQHPASWLRRAQIMQKRGNVPDAIANYEKALRALEAPGSFGTPEERQALAASVRAQLGILEKKLSRYAVP